MSQSMGRVNVPLTLPYSKNGWICSWIDQVKRRTRPILESLGRVPSRFSNVGCATHV
jgi:hypothetical protein